MKNLHDLIVLTVRDNDEIIIFNSKDIQVVEIDGDSREVIFNENNKPLIVERFRLEGDEDLLKVSEETEAKILSELETAECTGSGNGVFVWESKNYVFGKSLWTDALGDYTVTEK